MELEALTSWGNEVGAPSLSVPRLATQLLDVSDGGWGCERRGRGSARRVHCAVWMSSIATVSLTAVCSRIPRWQAAQPPPAHRPPSPSTPSSTPRCCPSPYQPRGDRVARGAPLAWRPMTCPAPMPCPKQKNAHID